MKQSKIKIQSKKWRDNNKEHQKEMIRIWRENNKENIKKYVKNKHQNDPLFSLKNSIRTLISTSLIRKKYIKTKHTEEIIGCSYEEFKIYTIFI